MKNIMTSLCLALFILSASVTITLNFRPLYYHDISALKIEETSGFSKKTIKKNYDAIEIICIITLILSCCLVTGQLRKHDLRFLKPASIITILLPSIVGVLTAVNWEAAFIMFHKIMFRNDYWLFDEALDPVIKILPDAFFFHCAVMIILLILFGSLLCILFRSFFRHKFML